MDDLKAIHVIEGTKVSHNYSGDDVITYSYEHLIRIGVPAIGIPAKQNGLVIIDVDAKSEDHRYDGRRWWDGFQKEAGLPPTYTVDTPTGGAHYYYRLPVAVNPNTFSPPRELAQGVDVKYNGWVKAPPTIGYVPRIGGPADIVDAPPSLIAQLTIKKDQGKQRSVLPTGGYADISDLHKPFTEAQIKELHKRMDWLQNAGTLSYHEWLNGLFALKAGITDPELLDVLVGKWTFNKSYQAGDEDKAREIVANAEVHGGIGPGSIFSILKKVAIREGAPVTVSALTRPEIIDKSKVKISIASDGTAKIAPSESNVAALIGAMFDVDTLYHDIRMDNYIFKEEVYSDVDLSNVMAPMIQSPSYGLGFENIKRSTILGGIDVLMTARKIDPYKKWLESLAWDKIPRIDSFFPKYAKTKDNAYTRSVGRNLWIAMAGRGISPGVKFDYIVVLEGAEGARKSTLCEMLGGDYYMCLASKEDINVPDTLRKMHQSTIVEIPELVGFMGKSGEEIKAILAARHDNIRDLYARKGKRKARGFIFIGTTNSAKYITESMGVRRYWPISIGTFAESIDTEGFRRDREQLFAEAVERFNSGEEFWEVPHNSRNEVSSRVAEDPLTDPVKHILKNSLCAMSITDVYRNLEIGGYIAKGLTPYITSRIGYALKSSGAKEDSRGKWFVPLDLQTAESFI